MLTIGVDANKTLLVAVAMESSVGREPRTILADRVLV